MKVYYRVGEEVGQGTYWGVDTGSRKEVVDTATLFENSIKAHIGIVLATAPLIGLVFAVFLPAIGIAMAVKFVGEKVWGGLRDLSVQSLSMGWRPLEAYLSGRKKKK